MCQRHMLKGSGAGREGCCAGFEWPGAQACLSGRKFWWYGAVCVYICSKMPQSCAEQHCQTCPSARRRCKACRASSDLVSASVSHLQASRECVVDPARSGWPLHHFCRLASCALLPQAPHITSPARAFPSPRCLHAHHTQPALSNAHQHLALHAEIVRVKPSVCR